MSNPTFSIITPTYNCAELLKRTARSIFNQTFSDFEWIIVDDGSTDNTQKIISSFADSRVCYIRLSENRGPNAARNEGLRASHAPYLVFLDSDDELVPEALEVIYKEWRDLNDETVGVIAFRCQKAATGQLIGHIQGERVKLGYKDVICERFAKGELLMTVRREVFRDDKYPEDIRGVEALLWWDIAKRWKCLYINRPLRIYRAAEGQLTSVESAIRRAENLAEGYDRLCQKHRKSWLSHCPAQYGYYLTVAGLYYALAGKRKEAISRIVRAWRFSPKKAETIGLLIAAILGKRVTIWLFRLRAYLRGKAK